VPFSILPALDVSGGRLAVAVGEWGRPVEDFWGKPVGLDLALEGVRGLDVTGIRAVAPDATLQVSGGIVDLGAAGPYLADGADRFVLSSASLADEPRTLSTLRSAGSSVVVGLEVADGRIRPRGSGSGGGEGLDLMSTVGWLHAAGAPAFLVTATGRVGGLEGPDVDLVRRVVRAGRPTFAAGGIGSLEDLRALRDVGAAGAVVGRAALEGRFALDAALAWAGA
jgi:phosphoribosylformimino-5-aminoimidazole carboxamide ribonucleotide (ProFAR) isomerase